MTEILERVLDEVTDLLPVITRGLQDHRGYTNALNRSNDRQSEADVWVNQLLKERLTRIDGVGAYASEEEQDVVSCGKGALVAVDPIDGSSNLPGNNICGMIAGIYNQSLPCSGKNLVGSFFVLFGPFVTVMVADENTGTVSEYVLEESTETEPTLRLSEEHVTLPKPEVASFGGQRDQWSSAFRQTADALQEDLTNRYCGALVGDVNQILHRGGIYGYPATEEHPEGASRILFEAVPMAHLIERAGGASSNGKQSVLDVMIQRFDQNTPLFLGDQSLLQRLVRQV